MFLIFRRNQFLNFNNIMDNYSYMFEQLEKIVEFKKFYAISIQF